MIADRYNRQQIPIDFLRMLVNRSKIFSLIILVNGHGQVGKSTFIYYMANRIKQIQRGIFRPKKATWKEWDYEKFTTTTPQQFVKLWDENNNEVLAMEEAGKQMDYMEWFGTMSKVFNQVSNTQGLKKNVCFLITPHAVDIVKRQRELVDFKVWVRKRIDKARMCIVRPRYIKIDYLKDKYRLGFIKDWVIRYPINFLPKASEFTNYLKGYKADIMDDMKKKVGLKKTAYERFCEECRQLSVKPPTEKYARRMGIIR